MNFLTGLQLLTLRSQTNDSDMLPHPVIVVIYSGKFPLFLPAISSFLINTFAYLLLFLCFLFRKYFSSFFPLLKAEDIGVRQLTDDLPDAMTGTLWSLSLFLFLPQIPLQKLVEDIGVEPMTSCVQGRRSSQLS